MTKKIKIVLSLFLLLLCIVFFSMINKTDNIAQSIMIRLFIIAYIFKVICDCFIIVRKKYIKHKYSYSIVLYLGLIIFLVINIFRHIILLFDSWNSTDISTIYLDTLDSFYYFSLLILPMIAILAIYCVITNISLIIKEGYSLKNLLGIFFGICIILGAFLSQFVFEIIKMAELMELQLYIKIFIDISLNSILCYFYCLTLATLYCNIMAARHKPEFNKDFIIILGTKVRDDGTLIPLLQSRVDKAIEFAKKQKEQTNRDIIFVPSGGQGPDEVISEAEGMKNYLIKNGIKPENILIEDKSRNTIQNMRFSKKIIDEINKDGKIIFSTNDFHVFRSGVIANNEGMDCEGIGSKTKRYFYVNALIREFIANLVSERKLHFVIITLMNLILLLLVFIGYQYELI